MSSMPSVAGWPSPLRRAHVFAASRNMASVASSLPSSSPSAARSFAAIAGSSLAAPGPKNGGAAYLSNMFSVFPRSFTACAASNESPAPHPRSSDAASANPETEAWHI